MNDDWERHAMRIPATQEMDREVLRDPAREMLETIVRDLGTPQTPDEQKRKSEGTGPGKGATARRKARRRSTPLPG